MESINVIIIKLLKKNSARIKFDVIKQKIFITVKIYNVKLSQTVKIGNRYKCKLIGKADDGAIISFICNFSSLSDYILFIFNSFHKDITRKNRNITIRIKSNEFDELLNIPYKKIENNVKIPHEIKVDNNFINLWLSIPKNVLFNEVNNIIEKDLKHKALKSITTQKKNKFDTVTIPNKNIKLKAPQKLTERKTSVGVTAIVLSYNKKCIYYNHHLKDVNADIRIVNSSGKIVNVDLPTAYCQECDSFFLLKSDFEKVKKLGIILCPIIDKTVKNTDQSNNKPYIGNESRIHQLGYIVRKNNKYTSEQRRIVLANIIENTNITKHEIQSNINRCIKQHQKQKNYSYAVKCWTDDYQFISNYKHGDIPEVIIDKIVIGKR